MDQAILQKIETLLENAEPFNVDKEAERQLKKHLIRSIYQYQLNFNSLSTKDLLLETALFRPLNKIYTPEIFKETNNYPVLKLILLFIDAIFEQVSKNYDHSDLLKYLIFKIRLPLLIVCLSSPQSIIAKKNAGLTLITELCHFYTTWKDEGTIGFPTYTKLNEVLSFEITKAEVINQQFIQILNDVKIINGNQQKRTLIFEKRLKETEKSHSKTIQGKAFIQLLIDDLFSLYSLDDFIKDFINDSWRKLLQLEYVREDNMNFHSAVQTMLTLAKSGQKIKSKTVFNQIIDTLPELNERLTLGINRLSLDNEQTSTFTSELELLHILLIKQSNNNFDITTGEIANKEDILLLAPSGVFSNEFSENMSDANQEFEINSSTETSTENSSSSEENVNEENINVNMSFFDQIESAIEEAGNAKNLHYKDSITCFNDEYQLKTINNNNLSIQKNKDTLISYGVQVDNWFEFISEHNFQKLIHGDELSDRYIYVDNSAKKSNVLNSNELINPLQSNNIKLFTHYLLEDSSLNHIEKQVNDCINNLQALEIAKKIEHENKVEDFEVKIIDVLPDDKLMTEIDEKINLQIEQNQKTTTTKPDFIVHVKSDTNIKSKKVRNEQDNVKDKDKDKDKDYDIKLLPVGSWVKIHGDKGFVKCKLAAKITTKEHYIFVDRRGVKLFEITSKDLIDLFNHDNLIIVELETNNSRLLESVITNTRNLKADL